MKLNHVESLNGYLSSWGSCFCLQQIQGQRERGESDEKERLVLYGGCVVAATGSSLYLQRNETSLHLVGLKFPITFVAVSANQALISLPSLTFLQSCGQQTLLK